jgi:hypothetical protein
MFWSVFFVIPAAKPSCVGYARLYSRPANSGVIGLDGGITVHTQQHGQ